MGTPKRVCGERLRRFSNRRTPAIDTKAPATRGGGFRDFRQNCVGNAHFEPVLFRSITKFARLRPRSGAIGRVCVNFLITSICANWRCSPGPNGLICLTFLDPLCHSLPRTTLRRPWRRRHRASLRACAPRQHGVRACPAERSSASVCG